MTLAKPSQDSRNPRKEELFEMFVVFLEAVGGVENLVISDEMIINDIEYAAERWAGFEADFVKEVSSRTERMALLKKAKRKVLDRYFREYIEAIADRKKEIDALDDEEKAALFDFETVEWDLANYLPEFIGRPATFPRDHAWLISAERLFFGAPLMPYEARRWTKLFLEAAGLTHRSVVYFVSLESMERVKIGFSSSFAHRLRAFRTASSVEPTVHLTMPGDFGLENELRERFRTDHIVREWFHLSPAIRAFIEEKQRGDP